MGVSRAFCLEFGSLDAYRSYCERQAFEVPDAVQRPVFRVNRYRSGETTGSYWLSGCASKVVPPSRRGGIETTCFSPKSRQKIRRAVENSSVDLKVFMTLTFSPSLLKPWHFDENGKIRHDYAKHKLKNFRAAISMRVMREMRANIKAGGYLDNKLVRHELKSPADIQAYKDKYTFRYIWTAELHKNGNIHFHLLINKYLPIGWLSDLWGMGKNAVDVKPLKDADHAANYITKYVTKDDNAVIKGNRYNISIALRKESKPVAAYFKEDEEAVAMRKLLAEIKQVVNENGGKVIDSGFGVVFPRPRKSKLYRDKNGKVKRSRGYDSYMTDAFLDSSFPVPF